MERIDHPLYVILSEAESLYPGVFNKKILRFTQDDGGFQHGAFNSPGNC